MPQRTAMIGSLPEAFGMVKAMRADSPDHPGQDGGGCRPLARQPRRPRRGRPPQRNPPAPPAPRTRRHRAGVPRIRRHLPTAVLAGLVLGLSTRRTGRVLPPPLGRPVPPATIGCIAGTSDAAVAAFHRRTLIDRCKALMPDGVVPACRTGAGAVRRPVPVAPVSSPTGARRSSTSNPSAAKAPPNGSACPARSTGAAPSARAPKRSARTAATASPPRCRSSIRTSPSGVAGPTRSGTSPTNSGDPTGRTPNTTSTTTTS